MLTFDTDGASSDARSKSGNLRADAWGQQQANMLNVDGFGQIYAESLALFTKDAADQLFLTSEENAFVVSDNYTVRYPGGAFYTMSTGLVSSLDCTRVTARHGADRVASYLSGLELATCRGPHRMGHLYPDTERCRLPTRKAIFPH